MKFYTSNSTGDAGLFYLGYWIHQNFGFPFRVMSADIGIDAEIEMINDDYHSEGLILKAQVKSTQTGIAKNFSEYLEKKHLDYWNKLVVPVLYFKVDLANGNIYYKMISSHDDIERTNENDETKFKINFNIDEDILTKATKTKWQSDFELYEFHNLHNYFNQANAILNDIITNVMDQESFDRQMEKLKEAERIKNKLESLKTLYPWKFGIKHTKLFNNIVDNIRICSNDLKFNLTQANYN